MAFQIINNVSIRGISACVPSKIEENIDLPVFKDGEAERVIAQTGIVRKHVVEEGITAADLCCKAFDVLNKRLGWDKESIDVLIYVTSATDFNVPPTACILQDRLGLSENTLCIEIRHGCPGWVIGLSTAASYIQSGSLKRAILLCGDTPTLLNSPRDKETRPLFGDAGSATALEYDENAYKLAFHHGTRGKDFNAIYAKHSGCRFPVNEDALKFVEHGQHQERRGIDVEMDGMSVFGFGLSTAPQSIKTLADNSGFSFEDIDLFILHQANNYMNEKIRKKLKLSPEKVPLSLKDYGNTSCTSIPVTIVTQCRDKYETMKLETVACGFGVGLAWASVHFSTDNIVCPEIIEY